MDNMAMYCRSRARSVLPLLAMWLVPLALLPGFTSRSRAYGTEFQDPLYPEPAGQDEAALPGQDMQPPGEEGGSPARSRAARSNAAIAKKARRSTGKNATGPAEKIKKGAADSSKSRPGDAAAKASTAAGI